MRQHDPWMRTGGALVLGLGLGLVAACAPMGPSYRSLHEVDGQVVASSPPPPAAYSAYIQARVALDREPPQLDAAQHYIERALSIDPRDPHLWTTRAEIEHHAGRTENARASARRALALRPGYPPAERVLAQIEGGAASAEVDVAAEP